ncbi:IPT/TIG domain-containing protein [Tenacibaculum sp. MAR_2010_89]|uniref:IPT/TIG domain-containing protein n=1 Tax=Tenacibaculum sp. MAR_2010_89 TaxID=1250198 RepID=UPI000895B2B7|nr:IPT/TIG domain-containing protein [Tenacibaculum sp. MAR_2010_89]SED54875.1 IPT/TIG domain-containing protein [Tenacibaculum sp. MAR_2010_89]
MKKIIASHIYIFILIFFFISCSSDEDIFVAPSVVTKQSINKTDGGVILYANFENFSPDHEVGFILTDNKTHRNYLLNKPVKGNNHIEIKKGLYLDRKYYYRAFIKTKDSLYLGLQKEFISTGSILTKFISLNPSKGNFGNEIQIKTASDISNIPSGDLTIFFNNKAAYIKEIKNNIISCYVPYYEGNKKASISINYLGKKLTTDLKFELLPPIINNVSPEKTTFREEITITGKNFSSSYPGIIKVFINGIETVITNKTPTQIKIKIPDNLKERNLSIKVISNLQETLYNKNITLKNVIINPIVNKAIIRESLLITGENFNPIKENNKVYFDGNEAYINSIENNNKLYVRVPEGVYNNWTPSVKVIVADNLESNIESVQIKNSAIRVNSETFLKDFQITGSLKINGTTNVFGFNNNNYKFIVYKFNDITHNFYDKKEIKLPYNISFSHLNTQNGFIYLKYERDDGNFFKIDIKNSSITSLSDFKGINKSIPFYYSDEKLVFVSSDFYRVPHLIMYEYDLKNNTWSDKPRNEDFTIGHLFHKKGESFYKKDIYYKSSYFHSLKGNNINKSNIKIPKDFLSYHFLSHFENNTFYFFDDSPNYHNNQNNRLSILDINSNTWKEFTNILPWRYNILGIFKSKDFFYINIIDFHYNQHLLKLDIKRLTL